MHVFMHIHTLIYLCMNISLLVHKYVVYIHICVSQICIIIFKHGYIIYKSSLLLLLLLLLFSKE